MSVLNPVKETIKLYAKQLRTPSFSRYENIVRQLSPGDGYGKFLCELMKLELSQRQEAGQRRRINKAGFPVMKTLDEFNFSRLEHVSEAYIHELASYDFIKNLQMSLPKLCNSTGYQAREKPFQSGIADHR